MHTACIHRGSTAEKRHGPKPPSSSQNLSPIDTYLRMIIQFPPKQSHWGEKQLLRTHCMSSSRCPTESELKGIFVGSLSHNVVTGISTHSFKFYLIVHLICTFSSLFTPTGPFHVYYDFHFNVFMRFLIKWDSASVFVSFSLSWAIFPLFV